jgi:hypothetical protein
MARTACVEFHTGVAEGVVPPAGVEVADAIAVDFAVDVGLETAMRGAEPNGEFMAQLLRTTVSKIDSRMASLGNSRHQPGCCLKIPNDLMLTSTEPAIPYFDGLGHITERQRVHLPGAVIEDDGHIAIVW